MSLNTRKTLRQRKCIDLPITDYIIKLVEQLGGNDTQAKIPGGYVFVEWHPGYPITKVDETEDGLSEEECIYEDQIDNTIIDIDEDESNSIVGMEIYDVLSSKM